MGVDVFLNKKKKKIFCSFSQLQILAEIEGVPFRVEAFYLVTTLYTMSLVL